MTFASTPHPRSITIDRLDIHVRGVDPSTVQAALNALPSATARAVEASRRLDRSAASTTTSLGMRPSVDEVAGAIAAQIAETVAARCHPEERSSEAPQSLRTDGPSSASRRTTP
jgi:hypothetical protein